MHDHNNGNKGVGHKGMLWMMLPCLLLFIVILFGGDKFVSSNYLWIIILGVCVAPHIWMMYKGHSDHSTHDDHAHNDHKNDKQ